MLPRRQLLVHRAELRTCTGLGGASLWRRTRPQRLDLPVSCRRSKFNEHAKSGFGQRRRFGECGQTGGSVLRNKGFDLITGTSRGDDGSEPVDLGTCQIRCAEPVTNECSVGGFGKLMGACYQDGPFAFT